MKQLLNSSRSLRLGFSARIVSVKIVQIALYIYLAASGAAVVKPSTIKEPTTPPRDKRAEVFNGGLQSCEVGTEKGINVRWPSDGVRVDGTEFVENGSAEGCARNSATPAISRAIAEPRNEASGDDAARYFPKVGEKEIEEFIHGALRNL